MYTGIHTTCMQAYIHVSFVGGYFIPSAAPAEGLLRLHTSIYTHACCVMADDLLITPAPAAAPISC